MAIGQQRLSSSFRRIALAASALAVGLLCASHRAARAEEAAPQQAPAAAQAQAPATQPRFGNRLAQRRERRIAGQQPAATGIAPAVPAASAPLTGQPAPAQATAPAENLRVAEHLSIIPPVSMPPGDLTAKPGEHPLIPTLNWARAGLEDLRQVQDYSCTLVKRERIGSTLGDHQYMFMKIRNNPFSVYVYFLGPKDMKGQEVIYIDGRNDGKMWAHTVGLQHKVVGTVSLNPTGRIAMRGNRYPITDVGLVNLVEKLVAIGAADAQFGECDVNIYENANINKRPCLCLEVVHPVPRRNFRFHIARIYVDKELNVPVRYESHGWPAQTGGKPQLLEEYTYLNLKFNNGFTDQDFSTDNPKYGF